MTERYFDIRSKVIPNVIALTRLNLFTIEGRQVAVQSLSAGVQLNLSKSIPCVVTCGALTRGLCMIWNPGENVIECISFC